MTAMGSYYPNDSNEAIQCIETVTSVWEARCTGRTRALKEASSIILCAALTDIVEHSNLRERGGPTFRHTCQLNLACWMSKCGNTQQE